MALKKFIQIISVVLCFFVVNGTIAIAASNTANFSQNELSVQSVSSYSLSTQSKTVGKKYSVMLPIVFIHSEPTLFSSFGIILGGQKVTVLSNTKFYSFVETENEKKGYIFSGLLGEKPFKNKSLTIPSYAHAYVGNTSPTKISAVYNGDYEISWSVSDSSILSFDQKTGIITGLKPGVATITARVGLFISDKCIVSVINQWKENETTSVQNQVTLRSAPGDNYDARITVKKGTSVTAKGDFANSNGWIYVSTLNNSYYGFIKTSDFTSIDYLMTQYHYFDKGFDKRFENAESKIYDYASVLNDVMMANFRLKVCPYVEAYTSVADNCKIMSYNSLEGNLAKKCPKNNNHLSSSCLTTNNLRKDLKDKYENGGGTVSKAAWTGHIMTDHNDDRSNATVGMGTIVFTPYSLVNPNTYVNYTDSRIKRENTYTLIHETGHQLNLHDHYCKGDISEVTNKCTNKYCSKCYEETIPYGCIMYERVNVATSDFIELYCDNCKKNVLNYIKNF